MKFSIGILAHNEEKNIVKTLKSLFAQSLFKNHEVVVDVVLNGCIDDTYKNLSYFLGHDFDVFIPEIRVWNLEQSGKANAWNYFVHEVSDKNADYLVLMDADIEFCDTNVLEIMYGSLSLSGKEVNVGYPIKSAALKKHKTLKDRISLAMSSGRAATPQLCGQLYMAKAETLRKITLPIGITGDDGFLAEMISTNLMTEPYNSSKYMMSLAIPSHTFEAYTDSKKWLKHEIGQVKGTILNEWLYTRIRERQKTLPVKQFIDSLNESMGKEWIKGIVYVNIDFNQGHNIPLSMWFRRFRNFNLLKLPMIAAATLLDWYVFYKANKDLNNGNYNNYWR